MKSFINWSRWNIATKILVTFLGLFIISMSITAFLALANIKELGTFAMQTSADLGNSAIQDSTSHLNKLGEEMITQKARDVAKQVEMYLEIHPTLTLDEMRKDSKLREIVVQPIGKTGYTTLIDSRAHVIVIHKYGERETNISSLQDYLPSFWDLLLSSGQGKESAGYYDWQEVDGTMRKKYAGIVPINILNGEDLTLWATTYIDEFTMPAEETKKQINAAISSSNQYIRDITSQIQNTFIILITILICIVIGLSLIISWFITNPIHALQRGAEAIGQGHLDYAIEIKSKDELGELANSFNKMELALKNTMEELTRTAAENIAKEHKIQENLHVYVQQVSQAQEGERKRISRELHDETAQALVVVLRHLDDLASNNSKISTSSIREETRKILEGVRRFSQELRPSILDHLGLVPAINWLTSDLSHNYDIDVDTEIIGKPGVLKPESELLLFRIVQEALTNVRKHSQASKVFVKVEFSDQHIKITVRDNGKGFNMPSATADLTVMGKLGLAGMQERAQLLGSVLVIDSQPGKGTTLSVNVPFSSYLQI